MDRNVLLLTADSVRYDAATDLADTDGLTLSTLRDAGVWFSRGFATGPGTTSSFPAILTGTRPLSHGGLRPLESSRPRLNEAFQQAGYQTGEFQCNLFLSTQFNYDRGFETFEDYQQPLMGVATRLSPRGIELYNPASWRINDTLHVTDAIKKGYQLIRGKPRPYVNAEVISDDTLAWLDGQDRFFCWMHYMDIHQPCFPPASYRRRFDIHDVDQTTVSEWYSKLVRDPDALDRSDRTALKRLSEAAIAYTDDQIRRLIAHLEDNGQLADTMEGEDVVAHLLEAAQQGRISTAELEEVYVENVEIALEWRSGLLEELPGKSVITSNHGELLGEPSRFVPRHRGYIRNYIGHERGVYTPKLQVVPWIKVDVDQRPTITAEPPVGRAEMDETAREEQLRALGYR